MIIRREIMKRKLKSRQKAISLVSWGSEMKQLFGETLTLDYMSSEEEVRNSPCLESLRVLLPM